MNAITGRRKSIGSCLLWVECDFVLQTDDRWGPRAANLFEKSLQARGFTRKIHEDLCEMLFQRIRHNPSGLLLLWPERLENHESISWFITVSRSFEMFGP